MRQVVRPDSFATCTVTMNNAHVVFSKMNGEVMCKSSSGQFQRGHMRSETEFAAQAAAKAAGQAYKLGARNIVLRFKGLGRGRPVMAQQIVAHGLGITRMEDITPLPTNGCRPRKARRL